MSPEPHGRTLWQRAMEPCYEDDLPPCPFDLTEPRYAQLLFTRDCIFCGNTSAKYKTDWSLRTRQCPDCQRRDLVRMDLILLRVRAIDRVFGTVPFTYSGPPGAEKRYGTDEVWTSSRAFWAVERRTNELAEEDSDDDGFNDAVLAYRTARREIVQEIRKTAPAIVQWINTSATKRSQREREQRWMVIRSKLVERGHADVDALIDDPLVRKHRGGPKALDSLIAKLEARVSEM